MAITLWPHQEKAHKQIIECFKKSLKTLLVMATGSGKSITVVSFIAKLNNSYKDKFIFILIVKNRKLVNQLAEDTKKFNLDYGVCMADHDEFDLTKTIQVCSIDTIHSRGVHPHISTKKDIILIIDEADQATSSTYQAAINRYLNRGYGRTFMLGMTATPYNGLDFFDSFINPITPKELLKKGVLVEYRYVIPQLLDYADIEIKRGEWVSAQVAKKLDTPAMVASCFNVWLEFGEDRQTLVFCVNKKHALNFCKHINDYYGKTLARFVCDKTSDKDRKEIFDQFEAGIIRFLINIRIITRGVDLPCIGCILDTAPTLRLNLHLQKLGRGSRANPFYKDCIVIDPAKNCENNNHFYKEHKIDLNVAYKRKKSDLETTQICYCVGCFKPYEPTKSGVCPYCGYKNSPPKKKILPKYAKNKLFMASASEEAIEQRKMINDFKKMLWKRKNIGKRYPNDIAMEKAQMDLLKKYGVEQVQKIKKSVGLKANVVENFNRTQYVPLGGLDG